MRALAAGVALVLAAAAPAVAQTDGPADGATELALWHHAAGSELEGALVLQIVDDFNTEQDAWHVTLTPAPEGDYKAAVAAATETGSLPDILDVEAADIARRAWAGTIAPLDLPRGALDDLLPPAAGRFAREVWSAGPWTTALALITRRSTLDAHDIRLPTTDEPWTRDEFDAALTAIAASGAFVRPFDPGMAWGEGWTGHAFAPWLASAGASLDADGLASRRARDFATWWQSLFARGLAAGPEQTAAERRAGLIEGAYAIAWNGNWSAVSAIEEFGDDLVILPPPDFGEGPRTATSSWQLAVSATSLYPDGGAAFIAHALQPRYQQLFADGLGVVPATRAAGAGSIFYDAGSAMTAFIDIAETGASPPPADPGHPVALQAFAAALGGIAAGGDVGEALVAAAEAIAADRAANAGYRIN